MNHATAPLDIRVGPIRRLSVVFHLHSGLTTMACHSTAKHVKIHSVSIALSIGSPSPIPSGLPDDLLLFDRLDPVKVFSQRAMPHTCFELERGR